MSSVRPVPETTSMPGSELGAEHAWATLRRHGARRLFVEGFVRFRYGDGFSHARAFALQLCLAVVPLVIAGAGLASQLGADRAGEVVARTVVALSPGDSKQLVDQTIDTRHGDRGGGTAVASGGAGAGGAGAGGADGDGRTKDAGELALWLGLVSAFVATTTAFAQFERGANRIYGTERDRPGPRKYALAARQTATAGLALAVGVLLIVAGGPFGRAVEATYHWGSGAAGVFAVARWPVGLALLLVAVTLLFRLSPRRRQPGLSWLAAGAGATVAAWLGASGLLALYVAKSDFGATYGPLTAVMALLLWANLTGIALLGGLALAAQLESIRAGQPDPRLPDSDGDGIPDVHDHDAAVAAGRAQPNPVLPVPEAPASGLG